MYGKPRVSRDSRVALVALGNSAFFYVVEGKEPIDFPVVDAYLRFVVLLKTINTEGAINI